MRIARLVAATAAISFAACGGGGHGGGGGGGGGAGTGFSATHVVVGNPGGPADAKFGSSVAWLDWNGDGRPDVLTGSPGQATGNLQNSGAAFLYTQNPDGSFTLAHTFIASDWAGGTVATAAFFGETVCVGDFDGDGLEDVAIGAPGDAVGPSGDAGRVYVVFNSVSHVGVLAGPIADPAGSSAGAEFGAALASGRVDGDTKSELAVGSPDATVLGHTLAGSVTVLLGSSAATFGSAFIGPITETTAHTDASFGAALAIGDMNGDGSGDLVVGVPGAVTGPGGEVQIWRKAVAPSFTFATALTTTEAGIDAEFGSCLAVADLDGDGDLDLAVGAPFGDVDTELESGYVVIFKCSDQVAGTYSESMVSDRVPEFGAQFGSSIVLGDVTGDGIDDLVIGAPAATEATLGSAGHITLFHSLGGAAYATPASADVYGSETPTTDAAFAATADLRDVDGDGLADIVVGVPGPLDALTPMPGSFEVLKTN